MTQLEQIQQFEVDNLRQVVASSNSAADIARHYGLSTSGKITGAIKTKLIELGLSVNHWHKHPLKYPKITKDCPICHSKFETQQGHPKEKTVCSYKCSNSYFKRHNTESKQKTSNTLKEYFRKNPRSKIYKIVNPRKPKIQPERIIRLRIIRPPSCCILCHKSFYSKNKNAKFCSLSCTYEQKRIDAKNGTHKGWTKRNIRSYAEKFFETVLQNNNINFEPEYTVGRYFLDFALLDKKIDLEIDGKQHLYEDRAEHDKIRDAYLIENGCKVYRIPWKSINNDAGKNYIKEEIDKFLNFYHSL